MSKTALLLIATGSEETEFTTVYDLLVRSDIKVTIASVGLKSDAGHVVCSRALKIIPDARLEDLSLQSTQSHSILLLPGGLPGAKTFAASSIVRDLVKFYYDRPEMYLGMICAAPLAAIEALGHEEDRRTWVEGKIRLTSHPSIKDKLENKFTYVEEDVVVHRNLITSRGPGTAMLWALEVIRLVAGKAKADEVRGPLIMPSTS